MPRKKLNGKIGDLWEATFRERKVTFLLISHEYTKSYLSLSKKEFCNWRVVIVTSNSPDIFGFSHVFDRVLGNTDSGHTHTLLARKTRKIIP